MTEEKKKTEKRKNVVIVMCKYSVVVKGIERKLTEMGCKVSMVTQENEKIPKYDAEKEERMFILYLPNKIMEDMIQYSWMEGIYTDISKMSREIIVVGDQRDREDLAGSLFRCKAKHSILRLVYS